MNQKRFPFWHGTEHRESLETGTRTHSPALAPTAGRCRAVGGGGAVVAVAADYTDVATLIPVHWSAYGATGQIGVAVDAKESDEGDQSSADRELAVHVRSPGTFPDPGGAEGGPTQRHDPRVDCHRVRRLGARGAGDVRQGAAAVRLVRTFPAEDLLRVGAAGLQVLGHRRPADARLSRRWAPENSRRFPRQRR